MNEIKLPSLDHVGVVVSDIEKTIKYFSGFGIGPFRTEIVGPAEYKVKLAFAPLGREVKLELLQVIQGKTIHLEFLQAKGEGIHHLGFVVKDLEVEIAKFKKQGFNVILRREHFAYLDTNKVGGVIIELLSSSVS